MSTQHDVLAKHIHKSGFAPHLKSESQVYVVITLGAELGLAPMQAVRCVQVVGGKPTLSADLMVALAKRSPECEYFRLRVSSDAEAVYETKRKGDPEPTVLSFTIEDAKRAQLGGRQWQRYPKQMLRARCASGLARLVYPDLLAGIYDPEEVTPDAGSHPSTNPDEKSAHEASSQRPELRPPEVPAPGDAKQPSTPQAPVQNDGFIGSDAQRSLLNKLWLAGQAIGCEAEDLQNDCSDRFGCGLRELDRPKLETMVSDYQAWRIEKERKKASEL